jgi:hypothetical protein
MLYINLWAIIVASIVAFVVGFLMHGPIGGKLWMKLANIVPTGKEKFSDMVPQMLWNLFANIVLAFVISFIYLFASRYFGFSSYSYSPFSNNFISIVASVFLLWVFTVAGSSMDVIWMGKSKKLWMFECLSSLLVMAAMGAVIAVW